MKIDYTRYYNKWHPDTEDHRRFMASYYRRIFEGRLPTNRQAEIIDIGCGSGSALEALKAAGYACVSGVETSLEQAAAAVRKGLAVEHVEDTRRFLQRHPSAYDVALAFDVLEHVPPSVQLDFAASIAGALRPGGVFLCSVPNANSALAARWRYNDWTHCASFTEHSLDFLLFNAGFDPIDVMPLEFHVRPVCWWLPVGGVRHWWALRFFRFLRRLEMMAELGPAEGRRVPLSLNLLAVARKK